MTVNIYEVNGETIDLPLRNPTASDLKKYLEYDESNLVFVELDDEIPHLVQDQEIIPANVIKIAVIPAHEYGGIFDPLVVAASIATVSQAILMVVDMWSRRAKKNEHSQTEHVSSESTAWDEVKQIRILMDNGRWVQFNSWLSDPGKVKSFVEVFSHPSATVKPRKVVFLLKNGSKAEIQVFKFSGGNPQEQLDAFLELLKH